MMKNYTTKEQSERIMNVLMIPASTADLVYVKSIKGSHRISFPDDMEDGDYVEYPVWSLGRLFDWNDGRFVMSDHFFHRMVEVITIHHNHVSTS